MSRQGFYRLPLSTIDAVEDGELRFPEWSLLMWLAANADFSTGLIKTNAPHLEAELDTSVVTIRKTLRKLRAKDWIFYTTAKRGLYPIGIYNYSLGENRRTPTVNEWRLKYGKSFRLISEGLPQINLWINLWINLNNEFSGGQLSLRESVDQSGGQSQVAPKGAEEQRNHASGDDAGQSGGPSADQSVFPAAADKSHVDLIDKKKISTHVMNEQHSTSKLAGEVSSSTNNLDGKIWLLYESKYRGRTRSGIKPSHSRRESTQSIASIRYVLDPLRGDGTSDDGYLRLLGDAFDVYFKQRDPFVALASVKWNLATFVARLPGILEEIERKVV